jgi:fumarate reductase flavoprotein subunit
VHGANRLGGNGVANSTVFGGIAGDTMAAAMRGLTTWREPDAGGLAASVARARRPLEGRGASSPAEFAALRERLYATMWEDSGIVRDAAGLARAAGELDGLRDALEGFRLPAEVRDPAYNLAWHDWLNLANLVAVSRTIVAAAAAREDSRGAHFRADFPATGNLATSSYLRVRSGADGAPALSEVPVAFTRVRPPAG